MLLEENKAKSADLDLANANSALIVNKMQAKLDSMTLEWEKLQKLIKAKEGLINVWKAIQSVSKTKCTYMERVLKKAEPLLIQADTNLNILSSACPDFPKQLVDQLQVCETQRVEHIKKLKKLKEAYTMMSKMDKKKALERSRSQCDVKLGSEEIKSHI
jgi:hypothetical protein